MIDCINPECRKKRHLYINANETDEKYGMWICHVCGSKGNLTTFLAFFEPPSPLQQLYRAAHEVFVKSLLGNEVAMQHLYDRGFADEHIAQFGYGYAGRDYAEKLKERGFTDDDLIGGKLLVERDAGFRPYWWNHIIIPFQRNGQYASFQGRDLNPDTKVRYLNLPGTDTTMLYHPEDLYKVGRVYLTEGAFKRDALVACGNYAAAIQGTGQFMKHIEDLNSCEDLWIVLDADANHAGQEAARKIAEQLKRCHVLTLPLPDDMEKVGIDDFLAEYGDDGLAGISYQAVLYVDGVPQKTRNLASIIETWTAEVEKVDGTLGYDIGHPILMAKTDGLQRGSLTFLAGSPHMGKTTFELDLADRLYRLNPELAIDFHSNDDSLKMMIAKWVARIARLSQSDVRKPLVAYRDNPRALERFYRATQDLQDRANRLTILDRSYRLYLEDTYEDLCRWREANPDAHRIIFFDGFSKTDFKRDDIREQGMQAIYRASLMKRIAQEADVPVVATCEVPKLYGKRPQAWDLRDSGQLEYDADVIFLCYQEAHVKGLHATNLKTKYPSPESGIEIEVPVFEINTAKDKMNGSSGYTLFSFITSEATFDELSETSQALFLPEIYRKPDEEKRGKGSY